jgi:6-pyruvoyltetrahydropterin/6-carboxytetrahydropterin synthase
MTHRVAVSKDYLTFSAAHFLTIPGHRCEALHGHNYVVTVAVAGPVDARTGFVVDFAVLKRVVQPAVAALDHRVLVPGVNPDVSMSDDDGSTRVSWSGVPRFTFPTAHVAVVPVAHTTAELLAEHLARQVQRGLENEHITGLTHIAVDVEESPGQCGRYEIDINA